MNGWLLCIIKENNSLEGFVGTFIKLNSGDLDLYDLRYKAIALYGDSLGLLISNR